MVDKVKNTNKITDYKKDPDKKDVYEYQDSGIIEGHAEIPKWLIAVFIALIIWGVYYTITYW